MLTITSAVAAATIATTVATGATAAPKQVHAEQRGPWSNMTRLLVDGRNLRAGVVIYGDSTTMPAARALVAKIERKGRDARADVNAAIPTGAAVDRAIKYLRNRRHTGNPPPRTIVMAVGANDTVNSRWSGPGKVRGNVERLRRAAGPKVRIVWVNVYAHSTRPKSRAVGVTRARSAQVNAAIRTARVGGRPAVTRVVDWYGYVAKRNPNRLLRDGVHTRPIGQAARNAMITALT